MKVYAPDNWVSKYIKQKLTVLKRKIDNSTFTDKNFNIPLLVTERICRHKISENIKDMYYTISKLM